MKDTEFDLSYGIIKTLDCRIKDKLSVDILFLIETIGFIFDRIYIDKNEELILYRYDTWIIKMKIMNDGNIVLYYLENHIPTNPFWSIDYTEDISFFKKEMFKFFPKESRKYKIQNILNGK